VTADRDQHPDWRTPDSGDQFATDTGTRWSLLSPPGRDTLVDFQPYHTDAVVSMWRTSFERALRITDPHPLEEQKQYLLNEVIPNNTVRVARRGPHVVGFIAATQDSIAQLYVHVDYQGLGIGFHLLQWAKRNSAGSLWLYTFERNQRARQFYESNGFEIVERGFEEEWQLDDLKLVWNR